MKRIVITGPTGAVGMALINQCIENRIAVLAICHKGSKRVAQIPKNEFVHVIEADLDEYVNLNAQQDSYDIFFHLAWNGTFGAERDDMQLQAKNIQYTLDAVRLAERLGCHTFVGAGSQAEYGRVEGILSPDLPVHPENGYGMAKLCAGLMSRKLCKLLKMRHIWTRILSVYGPYDKKDTMIMSALEKMLHNQETYFTKGEQIWDYLYSEDAARALLLLAEKGMDQGTYCIGSGIGKPLAEYIQTMYKLTKSELPPGLGKVPYAEQQVMHLQADISQLREDTGFLPEIDFEEGIKRLIETIVED